MEKKEKILLLISGILLIANFSAWNAVYGLSGDKYLEITFLNVGQGDSAFIQTPQKQQILIDGGPDSSVIGKLSQQMPFYDRTIDLIILSHPEKDHLAGLLEVLKRYQVENIVWNGVKRDTQEWKEWTRLIGDSGANIKIAQAGERILLDSGIYFDILNPKENLEGKEFKDSNDTSVVVKLKDNTKSFLFVGDISKTVEQALADEGVKANILKVAHHGSKNSILDDFYKELSAGIAVISVGKNSYGHPSPELLEKLQNSGIDVLRTDTVGDIKFLTDGTSLQLITN